MGMLHVRKVFGGAFGYYLSPLVARARTEVYQPVRALDQVEMMFDKHDAVSGVHEAVEHPHQVRTVLERESGRRLVEDVERLPGGSLGQFCRKLHPLRFAATELGGGLSEPDVAKADIVHRLQLAFYTRDVLEVLQGLGDRHVQHLRYVRALPLYLQGLTIVTRSVANFAGNRDVRQKLHLDIDVAVAGAGFAPASLDVEREATRLVAPGAGLRNRGEQLSNWRESSSVGGRI